MQNSEPRYALVEVEGGFLIEPFDPKRHLSHFDWTPPNVNLFSEPQEVIHLRDQILN